MWVMWVGLLMGAEVEQSGREPVVYPPRWFAPWGFTQETVSAQLEAHHRSFADCVPPEAPSGLAKATMETDANGRILTRELRFEPEQSQEVNDCMMAVLWRFQFPLASSSSGLVYIRMKLNSLPPELRLRSVETLRGKPNEAGIRAALDAHEETLLRCLDGQLHSGTLHLTLRFGRSGHFNKVKTKADISGTYCFGGALEDLEFPQSYDGEPATVRVVYQFESGLDY